MTVTTEIHFAIIDGASDIDSPTGTARCNCGEWQGTELPLLEAFRQWSSEHHLPLMQAERELEASEPDG